MEKEIRIRAFRATDDPETCLKFIDGHRKVLEHHGIQKLTSSNDKWVSMRSVFVIVVESMDKEKIYGGVRLHAVDGINPLPLEIATGKMDPKIYNEVRYCAQFGASELCGLWNSKEVAGLGVGSIFPSRVAVALCEPLGLEVMFSLCSPVTVRFQKWMGGAELNTVGNNGTFYYPKLDLLATVLYSMDMYKLTNALPRERERALKIRNNPIHTAMEKSPFKNFFIQVHYETLIPNINRNEFKLKLN